MKIVIYLIEDNLKEAREITDDLNDRAHKKFNTEEYKYEFRWLPGNNRENYGGEEWGFYGDEVINQIGEKLSEETNQGNRMGLLLDAQLTREDIKNSLSAYYPTASIAKKIYAEFCGKMPIYIITGLLMFGTQSEIIMGTDLSDSYIDKYALEYSFDDDVVAMFERFCNWEKADRGEGNDRRL